MASLLRARRVFTLLPDKPVIEDAAVVAGEDGLIHDVGAWSLLKKSWSFPTVAEQDLGEVDLIPGPINAHTHLELTHTFGATTLKRGFVPWLKSLLELPLHDLTSAILHDACQSLSLAGTSFVADVSSRNSVLVREALRSNGLLGRLFVEIIGNGDIDLAALMPDDAVTATDIPYSLMAHAPYTTTAQRMKEAKFWDRKRGVPFSIHLAEHPEEKAFLAGERGPLAEMVLGTVLPENWKAPGMSSVEYAHSLNLLDSKTLAVHCVQLEGMDLAILKSSGATVCLCPRSNKAIGVGRAPVEALREAHVPICLGTDGLCSAPSLDVLDELTYLARDMDPAPGLLEALAWVTTAPARFFGVDHILGVIAPGRPSRLATLPPALKDMPL